MPRYSSDFPNISITGDLFPVAEDSGLTEVFTIRLSKPAPAGGLVVNVNAFDSDGIGGDEEVSTTNISDIAINDQNAPTSFTIAEGATEAQVILTPIADDTLEDIEINYLTLLPGSGYAVDPTGSTAATVLLDANDPLTVSVFGDPTPVAEDSGKPEVFTIRLSKPAPVGGLVVNVNAFDSDGIGGDEEVSTTNISDIALNDQNAPVSFTVAEGATEAQVILTPIADDQPEGTEINYITVLPSSDYRVNPLFSTAITTLSDSLHQGTEQGDLPSISITSTPFPVAEDSGLTEVFTIRLSEPAPAGGLVVNVNAFDSDGIGGDEEVSTTNISDIAINDQNAPTSFTIAEGATEAQVILTPVLDDTLEDVEINYLTLLPGSGYTVDPTGSTAATVLLDANDPLTVSVFGDPTPVAEDSGKPEVFTIRLSKPAPVGGLVVNVNAFDSDGIGGDEEVSTTNISDIALNDQNAPVSFTIAEGATEAQVILTPIPDDLLEGTEINYITVLPGSDYRVNPFFSTAITVLSDSLIPSSGESTSGCIYSS